MESFQIVLSKYPNTFEEYRKWLYIKLNKDVNAFKSFFKYPLPIQIFNLIEFLQHKKIPILDAITYQSFHRLNETFMNLCYYMIRFEFYKLEKKIEPKLVNYLPF